MKVVYKQRLTLNAGPQDIPMDPDAQILRLEKQEGEPTLWFLTEAKAGGQGTRRFQLIGTGHAEVPDDATYVGTLFHGWLVLHLFELTVDWNAQCTVCGHHAEDHPRVSCSVFRP